MDASWQNSDRRREYSISSISVCVTFDLVTRERIQKYQMHGTAKRNVSPLGCATSHLRPANQFRGKKKNKIGCRGKVPSKNFFRVIIYSVI